MFPIIFRKGNNFYGFLFASLNDIGYSQRKEFAPTEANYFLYELTTAETGEEKKMAESIPGKFTSVKRKRNLSIYLSIYGHHDT